MLLLAVVPTSRLGGAHTGLLKQERFAACAERGLVVSEALLLADSSARLASVTTFDRNVVVIAGAGTGKTTLLVNRLLYLLLRDPDPLPLSRIVALTFTNKAATEMKLRLRERLRGLLAPDAGQAATGGTVTHADLRERYGISHDEIVARAATALQELERAQIGTLHSFAAHLLRLYPIEAGIAPTFRTDEDGLRIDETFTQEWDLWLDRELGPSGPNHERWRGLLEVFDLESLRRIASGLCSELIDLEVLAEQVGDGRLPPAMRTWLERQRDSAVTLLCKYDRPKRRKIESTLDAVIVVLNLLLDRGLEGLSMVQPEAIGLLAKDLGGPPTGWSEEEAVSAQALQRIANRLLHVDAVLLPELLAVVMPFIESLRRKCVESGWLTFDGLLARARGLLRDHPEIRERLKDEYRSILVDEFQDTDPVQYELVLYLAERLGQSASSWRETELEAGKLFIVGDPKQSIYAFRRADIEAFDQVVDRLEGGGALRCELATNFRSDGSVLEVVNGVFNKLLVAEPAVQPANVPLVVQPNRSGQFHQPGVEFRLVAGEEEDDELDAAAATRVEAEEIALSIRRLTRAERGDPASPGECLSPGHVALLFRKLTQAEPYLQALRRHHIRYIIDGEKHFYRRQEVIDLVNLLRCLENPYDLIALVGVLRSPLGGLSDRDLVTVRNLGALDYRQTDRLVHWESPSADPIGRLYGVLADLHRSAARMPLPALLDRLFERLPILELAAASIHEEQAVANLLKVRQMAAEVADRPALSLSGFVDLLMARLSQQPDEAESALAEETVDAVRVMTIHKAKGLEFPVVILAGLHHGDAAGRAAVKPHFWHDWSTGIVGLEFGSRCSLGSVLVAEKARVREQAERRRLFYVGMTRARECLILSGAITRRRGRGAFMDLLQQAVGEELTAKSTGEVIVGNATVPRAITPGKEVAPVHPRARPSRLTDFPEGAALAIRWGQRDREWQHTRAVPLSVVPSRLISKLEQGGHREASDLFGSIGGAAVGALAHRLLQHWDFSADVDQQ